jgi:hypothetical protein
MDFTILGCFSWATQAAKLKKHLLEFVNPCDILGCKGFFCVYPNENKTMLKQDWLEFIHSWGLKSDM